MKKLLFGVMALGMLVACNSDGNTDTSTQEELSNDVASRKSCPSEEIRQELLKNDASARARFAAIESQTENFIEAKKLGKVLADGTVEIPVVVNVLYRTTAENLSDARIAEQIAVLNKDYSATNSDINKIPSEFASVAAGDVKVRFRLEKIVRKSTKTRSWRTNDSMKKASTGGIDATNPAQYLNIWVVGDMGGILGYATFPESAGLWNDGVVLASKYTGVTGATSPYNLGRTATHEVGHYLNLRHIWGDGTCATDYVDDTPPQTGSNGGSPSYPLMQTCGGVSRSVMFMNYMDYVNDAAMYMFSAGQRNRMQAIVASTGPRAGLRIN
ncbi:MAG: zinc metalloprotease [Cloacibacterium sp.]|nr:zinc metalloprotease [Cloacibacterium sp.]